MLIIVCVLESLLLVVVRPVLIVGSIGLWFLAAGKVTAVLQPPQALWTSLAGCLSVNYLPPWGQWSQDYLYLSLVTYYHNSWQMVAIILTDSCTRSSHFCASGVSLTDFPWCSAGTFTYCEEVAVHCRRIYFQFHGACARAWTKSDDSSKRDWSKVSVTGSQFCRTLNTSSTQLRRMRITRQCCRSSDAVNRISDRRHQLIIIVYPQRCVIVQLSSETDEDTFNR